MAKAKTWYQKGKAGREAAKQKDAEAQARREQIGPRRFRLTADSSAKLTFLDNPDFFLDEHNIKLAGKYFNYFTCIQADDTCPICESGENPSYVVVGTVINHTGYEDRDGKKVKNQKQLFVAKGRARQRLLKQIERRDNDLTHCVYELSRGSGQTECATGEDFEYIGKLSTAKLKKLVPDGEKDDWLEPFDYEKIFNPKSAEELRKILGQSEPVGSEPDPDDGDDPTPEKEDGDDVSIDDLV